MIYLHFWCPILFPHLLWHQRWQEIRQNTVFPVADGPLSFLTVPFQVLILNIKPVVPRSHATELVLVEFL